MRKRISHQNFTVFFLMIFFAQAAHATWIPNGVPVGPYPEPQPQNFQSVSDGAGGAIVTWQDHRDLEDLVYVQRIDAEGNTLWAPGGTALCAGTGDQFYPQIVADGIGGAIIVWDDRRSGDWEVYAQRIDASGVVQWITDGVLLCTEGVFMESSRVISDEAGGVIVTWRDDRNLGSEIYAQRVDFSGAIMWTPNGLSVCPASPNIYGTQVTSDGSGGAIMAWEDYRANSMDIYAQRIDALGAVQWMPSGVPICLSWLYEWNPRISTDGDGGAIIAWEDSRNSDLDIYAQKINASGLVQWAEDGIPLCTETGNQQNLQIISDGAGGMIGVWEDCRYHNYILEVFAQRLDTSGTVLWASGGVQVSAAAESHNNPRLISDGASGAIVTMEGWFNSAYGSDIIIQRIDGSGILQWTADGVFLVSAPEHQYQPQITSNGAGGVTVAWMDFRNDSSFQIYAQQSDALGAVQWAANGEPVCAAMGAQISSRIISDGTGGSIISWMDERSGNRGIYTQRVDATGTTLWLSDGVPVFESTWDAGVVEIASDGAGGAFFSWSDSRNGATNIFVQRVDASGTVQWAEDGIPLRQQLFGQGCNQIVSDEAGGAIITWTDARNGASGVYVQRIDASGTMSWISGGVWACQDPDFQLLPQITTDGNGGAIVTWHDQRNGPQDIYAQRINALGTVLWATDGVPLCTAPETQHHTRIASDGAGGAIVTWVDHRSGICNIYAQRVDPSGTVLWAIDGVPLCTDAGGQGIAEIVSDGAGGAVVAWLDVRNGSDDIYAQRISALGTVHWITDGVPICTATGDQVYRKIITDGSGGAIVTWQDFRGDNLDVYAQRISASGTALWTMDGVPVCVAAGFQFSPQITSDDTGGAIIVWTDYRSSLGHIYAQRITDEGLGPICTIDPTVIEIPTIIEVGAYCDTTFTISNVGMGELVGYVEEACDNFEIISGDGSFALGSGQSHLVTVRFEPTAPGAHQCTIETGISQCSAVTVTGTASGGASEVPDGLPTRYVLYSCVPNPFNPQTMIRYDLPEAAKVSLYIYDIAGRLVRTLVSGEFAAPGRHESVWRGRDDSGRQMASGNYFYRLEAGKFSATKRMVLIK